MLKQKIEQSRSIEYYMQLPYSILIHEIEDDGEKYWIAEIPELPGCKSHGSTVDEAVNSVHEAKRDWILDSLEHDENVPEPVDRERFRGKTLVRMSRSLHRALSLLAESEQVSLNQLIVTMLAKEVGRLGTLNRVEKKLDNMLTLIGCGIEIGGRVPMSSVNEVTFDSCTFGVRAGQFRAVTDDVASWECEGATMTFIDLLDADVTALPRSGCGKAPYYYVKAREQDYRRITIGTEGRFVDDKVKSKP